MWDCEDTCFRKAQVQGYLPFFIQPSAMTRSFNFWALISKTSKIGRFRPPSDATCFCQDEMAWSILSLWIMKGKGQGLNGGVVHK